MRNLRQVLLGLLAVIVTGLIIIGALTLSFGERKSETTAATPAETLQVITPTVTQVETQKPTASPTTIPMTSDETSSMDETALPAEEILPTQAPTESIPETQAEITPSEPETSQEKEYLSALPSAFNEFSYQTSLVIIQEEAKPTAAVTEQAASKTTEELPYQAAIVVIQKEAEPTAAVPEETTVTTSKSCSKPRSWVAYTIRRGDTLSGLSRMSGVSISRIKKVNCLKSNKIKPGKIIYLPRVSYAQYVWHPMPYPMQPPLYYNPPRKPQAAEQIRPVVIITMPP